MRHLLGLSAALAATLAQCHRPRAQIDVPADAAAISKIDVHTHLFADRSALDQLFERWNMSVVDINLPQTPLFPGTPGSRWSRMLQLRAAHPGRVTLCATPDLTRIDGPDFPAAPLRELTSALDSGAAVIKIWKNVGMFVRDSAGRYVEIDDRRLEPLWDLVAKRRVPVIVHVGDPVVGWGPPHDHDPDIAFFLASRDEYPYLHPEMPRWSEIMAARSRWLRAHPNLTVVAAHFGNMADSLDLLAGILDSFPNLYLDTSARTSQLRRQPVGRVRAFVLRYQDRILYGSDVHTIGDEKSLNSQELANEAQRMNDVLADDWHYYNRELALPRPVLEKIYHGNAQRVLNLPLTFASATRDDRSR